MDSMTRRSIEKNDTAETASMKSTLALWVVSAFVAIAFCATALEALAACDH